MAKLTIEHIYENFYVSYISIKSCLEKGKKNEVMQCTTSTL